MIIDRICIPSNGIDFEAPANKNLTRYIQTGFGDVAAGMKYADGIVAVGIYELDKAVKVGTAHNEKKMVGDARVMFLFDNIESINSVIQWFENARDKLIEKHQKEGVEGNG